MNLRQWGIVFKLYTDDHDASVISGEGGGSGKRWFEPFHPLYKDEKIWLCPTAKKLYVEGGHNPFGAWKVGEVSGSYGLNGWVYSPQQGNTELTPRTLSRKVFYLLNRESWVKQCVHAFSSQKSCEIIEMNVQVDQIHLICMNPPIVNFRTF